jgi:hypothetical protein
VESSCKLGNEPSGSIKCWKLPSGCTSCCLSSGTQLHRVSWLSTCSQYVPYCNICNISEQLLSVITSNCSSSVIVQCTPLYPYGSPVLLCFATNERDNLLHSHPAAMVQSVLPLTLGTPTEHHDWIVARRLLANGLTGLIS